MAQTGYTPILIYSSSTVSQAPAAGNLTNSTLGSELAINITDGKLFYKDNANAVQVIGWKTTPTSAGGTGLTSYTAGDTLYYASGTTLSKLAIGSSGYYMSSSGTAPQWSAPAALTKTDDTNVTLTLGGSASTALLNAASLTLGWTGQLAASRGGTGIGTYTAGDILYASGTTTLSKLAIGASTTVLTSSGSAPQWTAASSVAIGTATNLAGGVAGSVPYQSGAGATTFLGIGATNTVMTSSGSAPQWSTALTLSGNVTAAALIPSSSTVPTNGMYLVGTNVIGFATNSANALTIGSTGNVGIGTGTAPNSRLNVTGSFSKNTGDEDTWGIRIRDNTAMAAGVGGGVTFTGSYTSGGAQAAFAAIDGAKENGTSGSTLGNLRLFTTNSSGILVERVRVFGSGGVSIGNTTDPGATNLSVTGTIQGGSTISVGAATPSTSGAGITFPATQSASSNANTLDDYEEGTWTPTAVAGVSFYGPQAWYTKVGNIVYCYGSINTTSITGNITLGGLPFTSANTYTQILGNASFQIVTAGDVSVAQNVSQVVINVTGTQSSGAYTQLFAFQYQTA